MPTQRHPGARHPLASRREFFCDVAVGGSALLFGCSAFPAPDARGRLVRVIPFELRGAILSRVHGEGWHGRLMQDLSLLHEATLVTPNERFYIRTRCPTGVDDPSKWRVAFADQDREVGSVAAADLHRRARPMGVHLLECAGNRGSCGLLSAAHWGGVPLADVLDEQGLRGDGLILVEGRDTHAGLPETTAQAGCSWIFTRAQLEKAGAFLATEMNGVPLPRDHGAPVRLMVPGWYGCTCAKWVQKIALVPKNAKPTKQMREYASRTHQSGRPTLARDYLPAEIDTAAVPIRVEEWEKGGKRTLHIVGIVWGGDRPVSELSIHISGDDPVRVANFAQRTHRTWTLWSHEWEPDRKGRYRIWLTVPDERIRTRRLDRRYYKRAVVL